MADGLALGARLLLRRAEREEALADRRRLSVRVVAGVGKARRGRGAKVVPVGEGRLRDGATCSTAG